MVFVDAWDSFARTLCGVLGELGADVAFTRCDATTVDEALGADAVVLGPGPGRPEEAGVYLGVVRGAEARGVPLLGVCLGHQALGLALGGAVVRFPPVHGEVTAIHHDGEGLFAGLPRPVGMTRYHSLVVAREGLPACLRVTATSDDGAIQGLAHATAPLWGVQFHPESVGSGEPGRRLLANFLLSARRWRGAGATGGASATAPAPR